MRPIFRGQSKMKNVPYFSWTEGGSMKFKSNLGRSRKHPQWRLAGQLAADQRALAGRLADHYVRRALFRLAGRRAHADSRALADPLAGGQRFFFFLKLYIY